MGLREKDPAVVDLKFWTITVDGHEVDLDKKLITLDRTIRFGLPKKLVEFLIGRNPIACSTRMAYLYESFYILHDIAYIASAGYSQAAMGSAACGEIVQVC